jgi:hypothetical protein
MGHKEETRKERAYKGRYFVFGHFLTISTDA